jgi:hypothetical protein
VPDPWIRAILKRMNLKPNDLFSHPVHETVDNFFRSQNIFLPPNSSWENVKANIFQVIDGKKILFEKPDSLFQLIREKFDLLINRESVAKEMFSEEINEDIKRFFKKLKNLI